MEPIALPFTAEYAKSNRSSCRGCKTQIVKDDLRLGAMVQSAFHDGKQAQWYHEMCFFKKQRPTTEGDFANFESLRYEDQQMIKKKIAENAAAVVPESSSGKGKGKKRAATQEKALKDFGIEYAASSRAICRGCELKIIKGDARIKKVVYDTDVGMKYGGQALWHHVECFAKLRGELGFYETGEVFPGYASLKKADQDNVKKLLPPIKVDEITIKKAKLEPKDEVDAATEAANEKLLAQQQKAFFKLRDKFKDIDIKKTELHEILKKNNQAIPEGYDACLERVCDILTFGALSKCKKCGGQYVFQKSTYVCDGNLTDWVKCMDAQPKPARVKSKIPSSVKEDHPFLAKYTSVVMDRVVKYVPPSATTIAKTVPKKEEEEAGPKVVREKPPLYNLEFYIHKTKVFEKNTIKDRIVKLGGKVTSKIHEKLAAVISTKEEVEKMSSKMCDIKELQIQVVPEDFVNAVKNGGAISFITSKSICDWGSDPSTRIPSEEETKSKSKKSIYTKSVPSKVKLQLKGGIAVDPASELQDVAHVYKKGNEIYTVVLNNVDIQMDKNSYYKIQVLEADKGNKYWVFRGWGRIGTTIGGTRCNQMDTLIDAIKEFKSYYHKETGNDWDNRENFVKRPGRFYPVDIDYSDEKSKSLADKSDIKSKLEAPIQDLVKLLFDVDTMKKVMMEFELDTEKMPLGRLSQKQLQNALKVLTEISNLITNSGTNAQFIDASNRFYSLVPHDFGVEKPTVIDTVEQVKAKTEMLDSLTEIEIAYSMLNADVDEKKNPIDAHYEQLKTEMMTVKRDSEEFIILEQYVRNTHAATHISYDLEIEEIFKINRKNEDRRYKPFKKLHNRHLLWHGSRLTNYVGILSHGLKIAPPEAPVTGYMFGKGIYFADMVSKSANYCCTSKTNASGLMLLCEVALGDTLEYTEANYVKKLPADKHSVKGVGRTQPNMKEAHVREDGVKIPLGKPLADNQVKSDLLYNEYIVYDVAQVHCQYLFKMKFNYKY